jgi:hypothetical protein
MDAGGEMRGTRGWGLRGEMAVQWGCSTASTRTWVGVPDDGGFDSLAGDIVIVPRLECPSAVPISISISFILIAQLQQGTLLGFLLTLYTYTALYMHTAGLAPLPPNAHICPLRSPSPRD